MTPEEKRAAKARRVVRKALARVLATQSITEVLPGALGVSMKDFEAAKKAYKDLIAELRKG